VAIELPYDRKRTIVVPVGPSATEMTPSFLHDLFTLVEQGEPVSLAFVTRDSTVTVNRLYNYPKCGFVDALGLKEVLGCYQAFFSSFSGHRTLGQAMSATAFG